MVGEVTRLRLLMGRTVFSRYTGSAYGVGRRLPHARRIARITGLAMMTPAGGRIDYCVHVTAYVKEAALCVRRSSRRTCPADDIQPVDVAPAATFQVGIALAGWSFAELRDSRRPETADTRH